MSSLNLEDWDFKGVNTKYSTHGIHYYPARMIPQIASRLISRYTQPHDLILDPFCGSGTVLLESKILNRNAIGFDINPLAVLLSSVKTSQIKNFNKETLDNLLNKIKNSKFEDKLEKYLPEFKNLNYWFTKESIENLLIIKYNLIANDFSRKLLNFLFVCFSKTIQEVSKGRFDGSSTHLRKNLQNFSPNVFKIFEKNIEFTLKILNEYNKVDNNSKIWVFPCDSRNIPLKNNTIDCIITSPPYGEEENTIGYMRWTKFSLYWLGYTSKELQKLKRRALGSISKNNGINQSDYLSQFIEDLEISDKRVKYLTTFYNDFLLCLEEMKRVLKPDKYCCIVIGNRSIAKKPLFMDNLTLEIAETIGFKHIKTFYRQIPTKAIPWVGISGKTIKKENIIILKNL
ncbi:MAG: TRM11 family SAM-dependent methyltransferase [Candidatus Helarchaeota archaeon]